MRGIRIFIIASSAALTLAACTTPNREPPLVAVDGGAARLLAESAGRAAATQGELARLQAARTVPAPRPLDESLAGIPPELLRPTTLQWSGPGEEAVRRIARIVGYEFRTVGNPPATLPMVNVSTLDQPAVKVLENLGIQSQPFAQVVVDPNVRRIEYRYLPVGGVAVTTTRTSTSMSK